MHYSVLEQLALDHKHDLHLWFQVVYEGAAEFARNRLQQDVDAERNRMDQHGVQCNSAPVVSISRRHVEHVLVLVV